MYYFIIKICFVAFILNLFSCEFQTEDLLLYKNPELPIEVRIDDLLERMTMEERIAQISHLYSPELVIDGQLDQNLLKDRAGNYSYGFVSGFDLSGYDYLRIMFEIQKYMVDSTRLGIPIFTITESLHGSVQDGSTIFPQSIALASTFDEKLAYDMTASISRELKAQGIWQTLSPGMDVIRELRWGRVEESFGEDPFLVGKISLAQVQGYLDNGISPMLKPYGPGGAPSGGLNLASIECSERELREIYLKPYEMVFNSTDPLAVMSNYSSWNRIPNSASHYLLTDILREEFGFTGYVYSDWGAVKMLKTFHRIANDDGEAARKAIIAGIDVEAGPGSECFKNFTDLVENTDFNVEHIDNSVKRVLYAKFKMGLFDDPFRFSLDSAEYSSKIRTDEALRLSQVISEESIVLLKNENNLLPINPNNIKSIGIIGPNADQVQFGDYTWSRSNTDGVTPLEGIKKVFDGKINYAKGCDLFSEDRSGFFEAQQTAKNSDLNIIFVGSASASLARDYKNVTSGEGYDLSDLALPGVQEELVEKIYDIGKPMIVVLVTGRPFGIPRIKEYVPAILTQWYGGEFSGEAIARVIFGMVNPSGKLAISFPQSVGHLPSFYNYLPTDKGFYKEPGVKNSPGRDYVFSNPESLWPFGFGLSYSDFHYIESNLSSDEFESSDTLSVQVKVENKSPFDGKEIIQVYINRENSLIVTPIRELKGFSKPVIKSYDTAIVNIAIPINEFGIYDYDMNFSVLPGEYEIQIGSSSKDIKFSHHINIVK